MLQLVGILLNVATCRTCYWSEMRPTCGKSNQKYPMFPYKIYGTAHQQHKNDPRTGSIPRQNIAGSAPLQRTHIVQWVELWGILDQSEAPSKLFVNSTCVASMSGWSGSTKMKLCVALGVCLAGLLVLMTSVKAKKGPLVTDMVSLLHVTQSILFVERHLLSVHLESK